MLATFVNGLFILKLEKLLNYKKLCYNETGKQLASTWFYTKLCKLENELIRKVFFAESDFVRLTNICRQR